MNDIFIKYSIKTYDEINPVKIFSLEQIEMGDASNFVYEHMECGYGYEVTKEIVPVVYEMDGNQWCAKFSDFINLQESLAGFGDTKDMALSDLSDKV
jgi:hypothetical protein